MMSKKKKITVIIVLVMAIVLVGIKITHFVIIERPWTSFGVLAGWS